MKPASFLYDVLKSEAFLKGKYAGTEKVTAESTWKVLEEEGDKIIDQIDDIVIEKIFLEKFEQTEFMRLYMKTPRKSPLSEVIEDLKKVMPQDTHAEMDEFAEDHKNDPITAVMHIWTRWTPITMPINFALMLDGYETFGLAESDSLKTDAIKKRLAKENGHDYKTILKYSIKFIRMVNYCIVYKCTKLNTEDRVTYRGVAAHIFKNVKVGQTFRVMNFNCTSSNSKVSEKFSKFNTEGTPDATMIVFQIPKGCYNAGKIEEYGYKYHKHEKETLIPPYTACKLTKRDGNTLYVEVAKDNKAVSFTHFTF